jgi:hypothetical protein
MSYLYGGSLRKAQENADGTLTITGIASDASEPDCDNEILDIERSWPYFAARMDKMRASSGGRNVLPLRVQHDSRRPAGHCVKLWVAGNQIMAEAVVEDREAIKLVESGTLSQLSFGGYYKDRERLEDGTFSVVIDPYELSLVDAACVEGAVITSVQAKAVETFRLYKRDGRMEVIKAKPCGCEHCRKSRGVEEDEDEIRFDRSEWTREEAIAWLQEQRYDVTQEDLLDEGEFLIFEKALTGVSKMNAADHSKLAGLHRKLSGFHKSVSETHSAIALHHEAMCGHGGGIPGDEEKSAVEHIPRDFTRTVKSFYDPQPDEAAGGLVRKLN